MLISLKEYAAKVGISIPTATRYAQTGKIPAQRIGAHWVIDDAAPVPKVGKGGRRAAQGRYAERPCERCGAVYTPNANNAKYCKDCRVALDKEQKKAKKIGDGKRCVGSEQLCPICGQNFTLEKVTQKYCAACQSVRDDVINAANSQSVVGMYAKSGSIRAVSKQYGISIAKVRKALITAKVYANEISAKAADLRERGFSTVEISYKLGRSRSPRSDERPPAPTTPATCDGQPHQNAPKQEERTMTKINKPFYTRANGAVKCTETKDGYAMTVSYGSLDHRYVLTTYFTGLDDMAEYIYFTAANESDTVLSIMRELEKALKA